MNRRAFLAGLAALAARPAWAADAPGARRVEWRGGVYWVVSLDLRQVTLELVGQRDESLQALSAAAARATAGGRRLIAATNAGIFHAGQKPVGLHVEAGVAQRPLNLKPGDGNFFLKPNGVFHVDAQGGHVTVSERWRADASQVALATQSGPILVTEGTLHPAFRPKSTNLALRSGVGVSDPQTVHLAISEGGVRFYDFAALFRDQLGCPDALYLDGVISGMIAPGVPEKLASTQLYSGVIVATAPA